MYSTCVSSKLCEFVCNATVAVVAAAVVGGIGYSRKLILSQARTTGAIIVLFQANGVCEQLSMYKNHFEHLSAMAIESGQPSVYLMRTKYK